MPNVEHYASLVVILVFFAAITFCIAYAIESRLECFRTIVGLSRISLDLSLAVTIFPGVLTRFFGVNTQTLDWAWYEAIGLTIVLAAVAANVGVLLLVNTAWYQRRNH